MLSLRKNSFNKCGWIILTLILMVALLTVHSPNSVKTWIAREGADKSMNRAQIALVLKKQQTDCNTAAFSPQRSSAFSFKKPTNTLTKTKWPSQMQHFKFPRPTAKLSTPVFSKQKLNLSSTTSLMRKNTESDESPLNNKSVFPKGWFYKGPKKLRCRVHTMGCFKPSVLRVKTRSTIYKYKLANMTDWFCIELCSSTKHTTMFAGLRNGDECHCVANLHFMVSLEESDECNVPCVGDPTSICGGQRGVTSLYRYSGPCVEEPPPSEAITESSVLGCYQRTPDLNRQMEKYRMPGRTYLAGQCLLHCEKKGMTLAIPSFPAHCLCGQTTQSFNLQNPANRTLCMKHVRKYIMVYKTLAEDRRCGDKRFLRPGEWQKSVVLATFPGSGNTWLRHLIESATGIYTGSRYIDGAIVRGGNIGERLERHSKRVVVEKSHNWKDLSASTKYEAGIHVYRNPYNAIMSEYNRQNAGSHTKALGSQDFDQRKFSDLTEVKFADRWRLMTETAVQGNIPTMIFSYEDLVLDPISKAEKMARFVMGDLLDEEDLQKRLLCLRVSTAGEFKRKKRPWTFDPFTNKAKKYINSNIRLLRTTYEQYMNASFPEYDKPLS